MTTPEKLVQSYTYNLREQVESLTADDKAFTYAYYPNGLLKSTTYPSFKTGVTLSCTYSYDNAKRLVEMSYMKNCEPYVKYNYQYDLNGNIVGEKVNDVLEKTYTFNKRGQLASSTFKDKGTRTYAYDSRGNRTKATGPVTEFKDKTETAYSWDAWDRLSNVKQGEETLASFKYDPSGIRYAKTTEMGTTTYNCDNMGRVITEYNEEGIRAQNVWGNGILARKVDGATYYYLTNTHGDVMEILDESGKTVNRYKYDEWGNAIEAVETIENPIRFAGEYFDEETGLYYLRARYYDPSLARFISKDSYEGQVTNPQSLNQYTYCDNNPIMFVDPTGRDPEDHGDKQINIDPGTIISIMDLTPIGWAITAAELKGADLPRNKTIDKIIFMLGIKTLAKDGIELGVKNGLKTDGLVKNSSWNTKGSFGGKSLQKHFEKHGREVGAESVEQYLRKAEAFKQNLKGAKTSKVEGSVDGVIRYKKLGKYIDLAPDGTIVSFGKL